VPQQEHRFLPGQSDRRKVHLELVASFFRRMNADPAADVIVMPEGYTAPRRSTQL
jgi:hypothetical protein